ncbi:histidine kinase famiy protein [Noviherbaspirillum pedocola]|uniref:histidine kinase n=1 Tax=Noviherbaspirillum pedocola TaxID=2801341 RepID=A0A934W7I6_9BURK|nr:histidine kinase famiy protein [Noviherbaspirillum pedocola]MBK4735628.1 PAS domain-containing protein [Noviherbaspirillum pedocola]
MATGSSNDDLDKQATDDQGGSAGKPAAGEVEGNSYHPLGNPGERHWQASTIEDPSLDKRDNLYFAAIEMTRMPMVMTDANAPDNPIVFVNRAFLDLTGYEEDQVLNRNCRFLQGPDTDPDAVAEMRAAIAEMRAVSVDILNYKADGTPFWNAVFMGPVFDRDGNPLYWFSSQVDITQRRASEGAFRQAQKMEAVGQLAAGMAHDFNNLLQVMSGNLEMAAGMAQDHPQLLRLIGNAQKAAKKGSRLTQQLLSFARKQRLDPHRINLNTLLVQFSEMLVRTLGSRVEVRLDLMPGLPHCLLDATHMEMALLNVLINARDAMPEGGTITVGTCIISDAQRLAAHGLPPGSYVALYVVDQGAGMPAEVLRRATEPFFTTKAPGTGLGLAMVHGFAQQSHGRLEIDSQPGRGTTVRMLFPPAGEADWPTQRMQAPGVVTSAARRAGQRILLVEDSDDVRQIAQDSLEAMGYEVLAADSGEEALGLLERRGPVDLLFTDVIMPGGINGLVLAERARQHQPGLPVLLATGVIDASLQEGASASSMHILGKPYRRGELAERVRAVLDGKAE